MAESGVYSYFPEIADLMREGCERAQIKSTDIDYGRLESAIRSVNFVLLEMANLGAKAYEMELITQATTVGMQSFSLPQRVMRVFSASLRRDGTDVPLVPISQYDYEGIAKKDVNGRPVQYWENANGTGNGARSVYIWPAGENTTDSVRLWCLRRPMAALEAGIAQTPGISFEWQDAFCDGLSVRLAQKFNKDMLGTCQKAYGISSTLARQADRERSPLRLRVSPRFGRRGR
jgi:hypothetical protein